MQKSEGLTKISIPTALGLCISLLVPLFYSLVIGPRFIKPALNSTAYSFTGIAVLWLATLSVIAIVRYGERQPLSSIGFGRLSFKWFAAAIGLGIGLSVTVPVLRLLGIHLFPWSIGGTIASSAAELPTWLLLIGVITAGVTEEILYRAYPLERLLAITGQPWLSGAASLVLFVVAHHRGWNMAHLVTVVVPLGAILTGLYLWRRNLPFVIIIHTLIDLPLVLFALAAPI